MTSYDAGDVNYLASHLTIQELRRERHEAKVVIVVEEHFDTDKADRVRAYLALVNEAMRLATAKRPKPKLIPGYVDVEAVKARTDIVSAAERYTKLRKSGKNFLGLCPVHRDKNASFVVYPEDQCFHCFGCQAHGDVISLVMVAEHLDFRAAVAALGG